jgi:hypothetical protein
MGLATKAERKTMKENKFDELAKGVGQTMTRGGEPQSLSRRRFLKCLSAVSVVSFAGALRSGPKVRPLLQVPAAL